MHTPLPIAAGIGIEGIIWIIILVFWGIAQMVQKSRRGKSPPGTPARPASPMETELRDLLEQLSGQPPRSSRVDVPQPQVEEEDEEPVPAPIQRSPAPPAAQRPPSLTIRHRPGPSPSRPNRPSPPVVQERPAMPMPTLAMLAEAAEDLPALKPASVSQVLSMRGMAMHVPVGQTRHGRPVFNPRELRHPQTLRQMILARMVMDQPKALERTGQGASGI